MEINYLDTGDTGHAVSADSDGALFAGIIGSEKYVLKNGSQFNAEVQSNNIVKISDGDLVMYGRHVRIPANDSALVTINNGHSGTNRIDLIAFRYTKDSTGKETVDLVVIQGEDSTGTPTAPTTIDGNILIGAMQSDFPLYAVTLNGINITKVEKLFKTVETNDTLTQKVNELNSTLKWSDWISLGQNALGVWLLYRYNAYEVELSYRGNLKAGMSIGGGSVGYQWPGFPTDLKPPYNFEAPIYSAVGDNPKLSLRFFPDNGTITITSNTTSKTSEEYISGFYRYTRR